VKRGDLVKLRKISVSVKNDEIGIPDYVGLIIEMQTRGPIPGAYVLWPNEDKTVWASIENLKKVEPDVPR
jgi:hypothetical protein